MDTQWVRFSLTFAFLVGCAPDRDVSTASQTVVYRDDSRVEARELDEIRAEQMRAVAALIPTEHLRNEGDLVVIDAPPLSAAYDLCPDERFVDQPNAASCSAFLVDDRILVTAGHCIDDGRCPDGVFAFDYVVGEDGTVPALPADAVYTCSKVLAHEDRTSRSSDEGDFAVIELDRAVSNREPLILDEVEVLEGGREIYVLGFPSGLPGKLSEGAFFEVLGANRFSLRADTFGGNSGSPVFDAQTRTVLGVLTGGENDYAWDEEAGCSRVLVIDEPGDFEFEGAQWGAPMVEYFCGTGYPSNSVCGRTPTCGDGFCSAGEVCVTDCEVGDIPDAWACSTQAYGDGLVCDCECGAFDPDCNDVSLDVRRCGLDEICDDAAECELPGWTCRLSDYGVGDGCDCACGRPDPDCLTSDVVFNCPAGATCDASGNCVGGVEVPEAWSCNVGYYDADDECDCECGAWDPDCDDPGTEVLGCEHGEICVGDGSCGDPGLDVGHDTGDDAATEDVELDVPTIDVVADSSTADLDAERPRGGQGSGGCSIRSGAEPAWWAAFPILLALTRPRRHTTRSEVLNAQGVNRALGRHRDG